MNVKIDRSEIPMIRHSINKLLQGEKEEFFKPGDKVKLNYAKIIHDPNFEGMRKSYKSFVEENQGKIFILIPAENHINSTSIFSFKEDATVPKWFFSEPDLILVERA